MTEKWLAVTIAAVFVFCVGCRDGLEQEVVSVEAAAAAGAEERTEDFRPPTEPIGSTTGVPIDAHNPSEQSPKGDCVPDCTGISCGSDGCGGSCGHCSGTQVCRSGACVESDPPVTTVCGALGSPTTWRLSDSPVLVSCNLNVTAPLTIEPGVLVQVSGSSTTITVNTGGSIQANGSEELPIVFTSASGTASGSWGSLVLNATAANSSITHTEFRYGGGVNKAPIYLNPIGLTNQRIFNQLYFVNNVMNGIALPETISGNARIPSAPGIAYWWENDVKIPEAVTLVIERDVVLKFAYKYSEIDVYGRLVAQGTPSQPVIFTSAKDDSRAGDSNNDGSTSPQPKDWGGIYFANNTSLPQSELHNVIIAYAGQDADDTAPHPDDPTIGYPILIHAYENPVFDNVVFEKNRIDAQAITVGTWSSDVHLDLAGYPYWVSNDITISAANTTTIDPGVILKFGRQYAEINVEGRLIANGTSDSPVIFTSSKDDARGGDNNADGATSPQPKDWGGIYFANNTSLPQSELHNVIIAYAGQDADDTAPHPDDPTIGYPILIHAYENPVFDNVVFEKNRIDAQAITVGTWSSDVHLDLAGYPYWVSNDITISAANTTTIDPGVILKFGRQYAEINVEGRLIANGTSDSPVIFTSSKDDARGGDTNRDGLTSPQPKDWGGIYFANNTSLPQSELHNVIIAYAGQDADDPAPYPDEPTIGYPILIHAYENPIFDNVVFEKNRINAQAITVGTWSSDVHLDLAGYPYWVSNDITISAANTATIDAGVILKFGRRYAEVNVNGRLLANGTPDNPVVFTSHRDDSRGGDNNADGATSPKAQDWGGIYFAPNAELGNSELHHVVVAYGGEDDDDPDPYPDEPTWGYPIVIHPNANPVFNDVVFQNNRIDAQALITGTWSSDVLLDIVGYPYWIDWDVTVAAGTTLRINPGVALKFAYKYADMDVRGRIVVGGDPNLPVVFTSARDDSVGGDSNRDGVGTIPAAGDWGGIRIAENTAQPASKFDGVVFSYGGQGGTDTKPSPNNTTFDYVVRSETSAGVLIQNTDFRNCDDAIRVSAGATVDLGGGNHGSIGNNRFIGHQVGSNNWAVYNDSTADIMALNCWWGYADTTLIDGVIRDQLDNTSVGKVIYQQFQDCIVGEPCNDGDDCTLADTCIVGYCSGTPFACDSPGQCETTIGATCNGDGTCLYPPATGSACNDGDPCTMTDHCRADKTCAGLTYTCDAPGPCETNVGATCNGDGTCAYQPDTGTACDDGDPCTTTDHCRADKTCAGVSYRCEAPGFCETTDGATCNGDGTCSYPPATGTACDDGNPCTKTDQCRADKTCAGATYTCDSPGLCETSVGATCNGDGTCSYLPDTGSECDDGDPCTMAEQCRADKTCVGVTYTCDSPGFCETTDGATCNGDGTCSYPPATGTACDDGNPCTKTDQCRADKTCAGVTYTCDSPGLCETAVGATCNGDGTCTYLPATGSACDDGDPCTKTDRCRADKTCAGVTYTCHTPGFCETTVGATCNGDGTCTYPPATGLACDDGNPCTKTDQCRADKTCAGVTYTCDAPGFCETTVGATCNGDGTCAYPPATGLACDDGNPCTKTDRCRADKTCAGVTYTCDAPGFCETTVGATCNGDGTCAYPPATGLACDDGNPCTKTDRCRADKTCTGISYRCDAPGLCETTVGSTCNGDGTCAYLPDTGSACDDGNPCTIDDICLAGVCLAGSTMDCDDQNPCTNDSCSPESGCQHIANTLPCDDGNACTTEDTCNTGVCLGVGVLDCDDNNICTTDWCDSTTGCVYEANSLACDDGNACTSDACSDGKCVSTAITCDDSDECTVDKCDPGIGCWTTLIPDCCSETHACPDFEVCKAGTCEQLLCLPCAIDEDCGTDDAKCLPVGADTYCLPVCTAGVCPSNATCTDELDAVSVCWPNRGWCECVEPRFPTVCDGDDLVYLDSCGAVTQTEFCQRGCVDGFGCCGQGTHADGDTCVEDTVEPLPDQSEESVPGDQAGESPDDAEPQNDAEETVEADSSDFSSEVKSAPDGATDVFGFDNSPEGNEDLKSGGCSATQEGAASGLALVLLTLAILLWLRDRRRPLS
ncbi:MAG TPA: hypothetical protein GX737_05080 [Oligoflexales bacterium]|nr:hypothetical protein [Oligoflexales bacterium]